MANDRNIQALLSDFLFTIYDHGTNPNAMKEARAILDFLSEQYNRPGPPPPPAPPRNPSRGSGL